MHSDSLGLMMGSLALFALTLAAGCGGGGGSGSTPTTTPTTTQPPAMGVADLTITINGINGDMSFLPNPASVRIGQKVAWRNAGGTTHTAGTFGYHCSIHPSMVGTLNVTQ